MQINRRELGTNKIKHWSSIMNLAALREFLVYAVRARYVLVAAFSWAIYDWLITLGQEIDLVWNRRGAWASKLLYAFTRYNGLALLTSNMFVVINGGWSRDFCNGYFYVYSLIRTAQTFAVQGALLLRIYVIYDQSMKILIVSSFVFACQVVALITIVALDIGHYTTTPGPWGCWSTTLNLERGIAFWWISLSFETYLCALVLGPAFKHWKSAKRTSGAKILRILIRDSFIWYFSMAACLLTNALGWTTNTPKLIMISIPVFTTISTIGGSRLLLNVRAVYFSSIQNRSSTAAGHRGNSDWLDTEGTVGRFWTSEVGGKCGDDDDGERAPSISMGVWSNEDVLRNRTPSPDPPVIMLQPVPPGRRRCLRHLGAGEAEGGTASSDGGLSMGPGVDDDEPLRGSVVSVSSLPEPQASSPTMIGAGIQRTKDPDMELGGVKSSR